jgi:hypothetical protein
MLVSITAFIANMVSKLTPIIKISRLKNERTLPVDRAPQEALLGCNNSRPPKQSPSLMAGALFFGAG